MATGGVIYWLNEVHKDDTPVVGKNAVDIGEMARLGLPVADGFIVSTTAYFQFLKENNLGSKIAALLETINFDRHDTLLQVAEHIQKQIQRTRLSDELIHTITGAYRRLGSTLSHADVSIHVSPTGNSPASLISHVHEAVSGEANLLEQIRNNWAILFSAKVIEYQHTHDLNYFQSGIAIVVQKLITAETSGVLFTTDLTTDKTYLRIEAIYGLPDHASKETITPDVYTLRKHDLHIEKRAIQEQEHMLVRKGLENQQITVAKDKQREQKITDNHILELGVLAKKIEAHFFFPQEVSWTMSRNQITLLHVKPVEAKQSKNSAFTAQLPLVLSGTPVFPGIVSGQVRTAWDIDKLVPGEILVVPKLLPAYTQALKKAAGLIVEANETAYTEITIPAIRGAFEAAQKLRTGEVITLNASQGHVLKGATAKTVSEKPLQTATKVYATLTDAAEVQDEAQKHVDGVGFFDAKQFVLSNGVHPRQIIKEGKKQAYVKDLATYIGSVCEAFFPRPVVYQTLDLTTDVYKSLTGGPQYEPLEINPFLGLRGAMSALHDPEVFSLELAALKQVRETRGFRNLSLSLPFVRSPHELHEIKQVIAASGLHRSPSFKLWLAIDLPVNVLALDEFIAIGIDGIIIHPDTLATLILGKEQTDTPSLWEQNEAVLWACEHVIKTSHKHHVMSSIHLSAAFSPSLLAKLVHWGVTSVSVSLDMAEKTREYIATSERQLILQRAVKKLVQ